MAQGDVSIAIRPEKIRMTVEAPTDDVTKVQGKITDWAYFGDTSHIYVQPEHGPRLSVTVQNATRATTDDTDIGDQVWLSWRAEDTLLLDR